MLGILILQGSKGYFEDHIDRALAAPLASSRAAYAVGLAAVNTYAQATKGAPFAELSPDGQDAVLREMEKNTATGFVPKPAEPEPNRLARSGRTNASAV